MLHSSKHLATFIQNFLQYVYIKVLHELKPEYETVELEIHALFNL